MKRYIPLAVVAVFLLMWIGALHYTWPAPEPSPPVPPVPPEPSTVSIVGPLTVRVGELVVYTTENKAKFTQWTTVPDDQQIVITNDDQVLVVVFDSPGEYYVILASSTGNEVGLTKLKVTVSGEGPDPPRPPPIPPDPDPKGPDANEWAKWTKASVLKITYPSLRVDATKLSGQLSSFAAQIAAGAVKNEAEARVKLRQLSNKTLGRNAKYWVEFSKNFAKRAEKLEGLSQYQIAYAAVASGLKTASIALKNPYDAAISASKEDKRAVLVVITSEDCLPCTKLKSEWLSTSTSYGNARLVMLDRSTHKDVVEIVGTGGMKGRIKVPQVHILRYVDGKWQQFSRVGYTSASSMDRWVKSVFAWEEKS